MIEKNRIKFIYTVVLCVIFCTPSA